MCTYTKLKKNLPNKTHAYHHLLKFPSPNSEFIPTNPQFLTQNVCKVRKEPHDTNKYLLTLIY